MKHFNAFVLGEEKLLVTLNRKTLNELAYNASVHKQDAPHESIYCGFVLTGTWEDDYSPEETGD